MTQQESINSVGIIGCGWLGTALARSLIEQQVNVLATRSTHENVEQLKEQNIPSQVLLLPENIELLKDHPVFKQQCLVIAITPQFRHGRMDYAEKVTLLVKASKQQKQVQRIILLSSSAVYNGLSGTVNEECALDFSAEKVQILHDAEKAVLDFACESESESKSKNKNRKSYVLRLAGLVGPNRHPGKFLLNGRMLTTPKAAVNLIHQQDAQGLIFSLLSTATPTGIFNGVSQTHVNKQTYYQAAAKALSLPEPQFNHDDDATPLRIVCGDKAKHTLSYQFVYPDLLTWL